MVVLRSSANWCFTLGFLITIQSPCVVPLSTEVMRKIWESFKVPLSETEIQSQDGVPDCVALIKNDTLNDTIKAFDAFGKLPAGILIGNYGWLGHYDECEGIHDFQYCLVEVNNVTIHSMPSNIITQGDSLHYGMCVPRECTPEEVSNSLVLEDIFDVVGPLFPPQSTTVHLQVKYKPWCTASRQQFHAGFFITVVFLGILFLFVVSASIYFTCQEAQVIDFREPSASLLSRTEQGRTNSQEETSPLVEASSSSVVRMVSGRPTMARRERSERGDSRLDRIIYSFALPQNIPKLLSGNTSDTTILCLNGVRVISLFWVILGHVFGAVSTFTEPYNPQAVQQWYRRFFFPIVSDSYFSVDTFFFLSGLLVSYVTLNRLKRRRGRFPWGWFYFHRYWRLTPALAVTLVFYLFVTPYFGRGPFAQMLSIRSNCPKYWWTDLLYINNFIPQNISSQCLPWAWYLANDMQFFIISPLIIKALYHFPVIGLSIIAVLSVTSMSVTGLLTAFFKFSAAPPKYGEFTTYLYWDVVFTKPYCRIVPYLVGMAIGYVFYKYPKGSIRINGVLVFLGWTILGTTGGAVINMISSLYNGKEWPDAGYVIYQILCHLVWTSYVAWVVFVCHYGYGGWINAILSHDVWAPFSRLTYSAYLIHPILILVYISNLGTAPYLSLQLMVFTFTGISILTFASASLLSLMVEYPLSNLEKMFLPRR